MGLPASKVERRVRAMQSTFPDATGRGYEDLIANMTNDPKDRHVLAAGIRASCEVLVTFNPSDFPKDSVSAYDIDIVHPDQFLLDQLDLYPGATVAAADRRLLQPEANDGSYSASC